jgi:hypothetical protein
VFWIIRSAARSVGRSRARSEPKPKAERTPAGALAVLAIFAAMAYTVGTEMVTGHLPATPVMFAIPVILGFTVLGGTLGKALKGTRVTRSGVRALDHIPVVPSAADERRKTLEMRAIAAGAEFHGDTAIVNLPPPPQAHPRPATRGVTTRRQIKLDAGEDERLLRVAAIIVQPCPFCGADEGELCLPIEGYKAYLLDQARGIFTHPMRIARAISLKSAKLEDVIAQFGDIVPDEIWGMLL